MDCVNELFGVMHMGPLSNIGINISLPVVPMQRSGIRNWTSRM